MQEQPKKITVGPEAREKMLSGVEKLYAAVSSTLGPRSANVAIARPFGRPAVVHDGVTVARAALPLADEEENVGAEIAFDAADKTNGIGDGTTTATILTREIARKAHQLIVAGAKPMALREGIEAATEVILGKLSSMARAIVVDSSEVLRIATVSAQNEQIGEMVASAYKELGKEGILTVEESRTTESFLELKKGMEFDRGWLSQHFVTPGNTLGEAELNNPYVLVTDYRINSLEQFAPMLNALFSDEIEKQKVVPEILVIAEQLGGEALGFLVYNHAKGVVRGLAVNAPSFGEKRFDMLQDIAIVTGATLVSETSGIGLQSVTKEMLGRARKVVSTKDTTLIVDPAGAQEDIDMRIGRLKSQSDNADLGEYDREKILERLARLSSGIGILTIGAKSESEMRERKERAIDAISATKAALQEGVVAGGGTSFIRAAMSAVDDLAADERGQADRDFITGVQIVLEACQEIFNKLLTNAGMDPGRFIDAVVSSDDKGVDVTTKEVVDMLENGIIDPVMVVRGALGNASSAAVMIATSNTVITELPRKEVKA